VALAVSLENDCDYCMAAHSTFALMANKGHVTAEQSRALLDAGYTRAALFEIVAQAGHTTQANFAHSISNAPLDSAFQSQVWDKATVSGREPATA
jgi:AhpD family alkylhydroperoxidase